MAPIVVDFMKVLEVCADPSNHTAVIKFQKTVEPGSYRVAVSEMEACPVGDLGSGLRRRLVDEQKRSRERSQPGAWLSASFRAR